MMVQNTSSYQMIFPKPDIFYLSSASESQKELFEKIKNKIIILFGIQMSNLNP
jgi:hypothetical protein